MQAVAHNPAFAKKVGVPQSVGKEFTKADGGSMKESKAMMKKEVSFMKKKGAPKSMVKHEMAEAGMKKGGNVKKMAFGGKLPSRFAEAMQTLQNPKPTTPLPGPKGSPPKGSPTLSGPRNIPIDNVGSGGPMDPTSPGYVRPNFVPSKPRVGPTNINKPAGTRPGMASGGLAAGHKAADGIATKGKTKAKQVKMSGSTGMKKGGMTKMRYGGKTC